MVLFTSDLPDLDIPRNITDWDFLFDSPYSPVTRYAPNKLAGYTNAITGQRIRYDEARDYSTWLSTALVKNHGLKPGDTVSLFSQNSIWYPIALFGGIRAGAKISGASPAYNAEEMTYALKTADSKYLMTTAASMEVALQAAKAAGLPKERIFLLEGRLDGFASVQDLIELGKSHGEAGQIPAFKLPAGKKNGDVCGFLSFSSGTTGLPKAVMISHQNMIAQCMQLHQVCAPDYDKILAVIPLFHTWRGTARLKRHTVSGLVHFIHFPVLANSEIYMLPGFKMDTMLGAIEKYKIRDLFLVPPIVIRLARDPIVDKYDLKHVRRVFSGAAPTPAEILQLIAKRFPGCGFRQGYGMTESCSCITCHPFGWYDFKYAHKGGKIVANTQVKVIKDDGSEAGIGEPGEILARGPQIVMGYLNNEKATAETFDADSFLHTGDSGFFDADGMVQIVDRIKEMIKVKGIGVAPAELEDLLQGHASVADCAVMGIPDDYAGELPKAFVVVAPGVCANEDTAREIMAFVRGRKVRYKHIREIEFVDEIPKSASGKILRRVLRERKRGGERGVCVRDVVDEKARL
ncbi:acetyl-CoA synthetase-like protein [Pseudovirgaria hyperparasitica]|uniref:Acetyl-CoA synthetase-like protein n=1 Tax=Pseudovirgaria hyperparasitica TaxID=470096 RepID=A0A6A6W1H3_9PEZI|nr:acetyl-CoA synthetase-like protein [Pseudovirgaria hyperparasitica]KAF2755780.1 acetyl-CoA synthetase-like protein [Pseudovirgaria hyperparasitica]